ncbi:hypothetical protein CR513_04546, partial [Mucuna pruriens]
MILKDDGDIDSKSSQEEASTLGSERCLSEEVPYEGDLLMVRRLMSAFVEDDLSKRENIFCSRCMIQGKYCSLHRLSEKGVTIVDKQVNVELILSKYKDEILCDVVPMEATHFDKKVTHDGVTNKFSFVWKGNKVILKPLTPREVIDD